KGNKVILDAGEAKHCEHEYAELFGCGPGSYPFRYLGIPMHFHKLRNADWGVIEDRFKHKLSTWKAKHLAYGGIWQNLLRNKYLSSKCLSQVQIKPGNSHFLKGLLKVGSNPLKDQFPSLYNIVHYPHKTVANVFSQMPINITFRRYLVGDKLIAWHNLLAKIANVQLSNERDAFTWRLHRHEEHIGCDFEHCCNMKIKRRPSTWRARHWRSLHWRFLPTMDGEAIIDYASNYI
ncbi:hypothetical protein U9M48_012144, partial [Paspalum notatum var. saurae]